MKNPCVQVTQHRDFYKLKPSAFLDQDISELPDSYYTCFTTIKIKVFGAGWVASLHVAVKE
jgi:hypothetical protein